VQAINTATLGKAKVPKAAFDAPDGSSIEFYTTILAGSGIKTRFLPGPFTYLPAGKTELKVW
jgi:hypothetical protein